MPELNRACVNLIQQAERLQPIQCRVDSLGGPGSAIGSANAGGIHHGQKLALVGGHADKRLQPNHQSIGGMQAGDLPEDTVGGIIGCERWDHDRSSGYMQGNSDVGRPNRTARNSASCLGKRKSYYVGAPTRGRAFRTGHRLSPRKFLRSRQWAKSVNTSVSSFASTKRSIQSSSWALSAAWTRASSSGERVKRRRS